LSTIGLGLILYSLFQFSKATPFPRLHALIPTVGVALIILSATPETLTGKSAKVFGTKGVERFKFKPLLNISAAERFAGRAEGIFREDH
jgi:hypothetical protein